MVVRSLVLAGAVALAAGTAGCSASGTANGAKGASSSSSAASAAATAQRVAATTAAYNAIEAKIAAGGSLGLNYPDPTAATDILDYGVNDLWKKGIDGAGVTVAYIVTNPDPGLAASMKAYDTAMHLPPADISDLALPAPSKPHFACKVQCDPSEDRLDAEALHSMAPYAKILFVHPPVPETIGMQGWPQVAQAIKMIADRHLANVISVSLGDGENAFSHDPTNPGTSQRAAVRSLDPAFLDAAARGVPVSFAAGDCGPTSPPVTGDSGQCTPATGVTGGHPVDSPWVTAVGGTIPDLGLDSRGGRVNPDTLWSAADTMSDAAGAGVSAIYAKPSWQQSIPALKNVKGRAYPDISLDASDGTSQATPTFSGILALATQVNHGDLGTVNPALAAIGPRGKAAGIIDVPAGSSNSAYGVKGYSTAAGYDIASGWGTVSAPDFVPALVKAVAGEQGAPARAARGELNGLQSDSSVSGVGSGTVTVTGHGFVPGRTPNGTSVTDGFGVYPPLPGEYGAQSGDPQANPSSKVPGQPWDTVTATLSGPGTSARPVTVTPPDGNGTVHASVATSALKPGTYTVTITGLLLTQTATFTVK